MTSYSWNGGSSPLFGVARLRYDFGSANTLGAVLTAREDGRDYSRVAAADYRFYHSKLYWAQFQAAQSWTDSLANHKTGSILQGDWDRTGRAWGFNYTLTSVDPASRRRRDSSTAPESPRRARSTASPSTAHQRRWCKPTVHSWASIPSGTMWVATTDWPRARSRLHQARRSAADGEWAVP